MHFNKSQVKKQILYTLISFIGLCIFSGCSTSRDSFAKGEMEKLINEGRLTFVAESVMPLRQPARHLTSLYDLKITADSVISFLPYFGRAYQAPMDPGDIGIQFTSTDFAFQVNNVKEKRWNISIKPNDVGSIQEMLLEIFSNGTASLQVTSTHREPISFRGYIKKQ